MPRGGGCRFTALSTETSSLLSDLERSEDEGAFGTTTRGPTRDLAAAARPSGTRRRAERRRETAVRQRAGVNAFES